MQSEQAFRSAEEDEWIEGKDVAGQMDFSRLRGRKRRHKDSTTLC